VRLTRPSTPELEVVLVDHPGNRRGVPIARLPGELPRREPRGTIPDPRLEAGVQVCVLRLEAGLAGTAHTQTTRVSSPPR
jgi:hypothetical protein